jgi:S1 RNA binding domain
MVGQCRDQGRYVAAVKRAEDAGTIRRPEAKSGRQGAAWPDPLEDPTIYAEPRGLVASSSGPAIAAALKWIKSIVSEPEVGEIYDGKVVKIVDFGAFVTFFGARDGLVHVSELAPRRQGDRRRQRRRHGEGEAPGLRQSRQGAPVDEAGRPADRRRPIEEAGGRPAAGGSERRVIPLTLLFVKARRAISALFCSRGETRSAG